MFLEEEPDCFLELSWSLCSVKPSFFSPPWWTWSWTWRATAVAGRRRTSAWAWAARRVQRPGSTRPGRWRVRPRRTPSACEGLRKRRPRRRHRRRWAAGRAPTPPSSRRRPRCAPGLPRSWPRHYARDDLRRISVDTQFCLKKRDHG